MSMEVYVLFLVTLIPQISALGDCTNKGDLSNERRLILIGKTGVGKSTTGNSILDKNVFYAPKLTAKSTTKTCHHGENKRGDKKLLVVDTPGLGDTALGYDQFRTLLEILNGFVLTSPGPHVILFVLSPEKVNINDEDNLKAYYDAFGSDVNKYTIAIFTHVSDSQESNIPEYISSFNEGSVLSKLMQDTNYRYVIFGDPKNKTRREMDVKLLFEKIERLMEQNSPKCFLSHISELTEKVLKHLGKGDRDKGREKFKEAIKWLISVGSRVALLLTLGYHFGLVFTSIAIIEGILNFILYFL